MKNNFFDYTLKGIVFIFILAPLLVFFVEGIFSFRLSEFSTVYFKLVFRAFAWGSLQALLSAAFVCMLSSLFAVLLLSHHKHFLSIPLIKTFGLLYFVMPGTALSLVFFNLPFGLSLSMQGWPLIIFAHICWSLFFMTDQLYRKLYSWMHAEGYEHLKAAQTLGASPRQSLFHIVFPFLKFELKPIFALVFIWSLGAFTTVLLLGHGPQHSTPEVLLFYTLLNDVNTSRLMLLLGLTLGLQILVIKKVYIDSPMLKIGTSEFKAKEKNSARLGLPKIFSHIPLLCCSVLALLLLLHTKDLFLHKAPLEITNALSNSIYYSAMTCCWVFLFALMLSLASQHTRRLCLFLFAISPVILATAWSSRLSPLVHSDDFFSSALLSSFGLSLVMLPLLSLWIDAALNSLNTDYLRYSQSLGLNRWQFFYSIQLPYLAPVYEKICIYSFCIGLGDLALSSLFLREFDLLPLMARKLTQNYDFSASAWVLVATLASAAVLALTVSVLRFFATRRHI